ncbi:MAG: peptide-binding protein [Pirellulaceae bacterium]|nr:MAG: peptide-binding protein [Pirellulaceae bacterium]GIW91386.1 MAG: peptide-binding protein [Pirellulaceae bacterium]GIW93903.1 MAG: peptide-binding protein [Pirellulaceae bacterium]
MAEITLRVIDGADRGRVFHMLRTPVTIGREEGNTVQLNDERVSRFHLKIQEDHDRIVLTDLDSTNGTRVNGEEVQLRILRHGDIITVGRTVLLFGSREEIAQRIRQMKEEVGSGEFPTSDVSAGASHVDLEEVIEEGYLAAVGHEPPELPARLSPAQAAQLYELLEYIHRRIRDLIQSVKPVNAAGRVTLDWAEWQELLDVQARLAEYMHAIGSPES